MHRETLKQVMGLTLLAGAWGTLSAEDSKPAPLLTFLSGSSLSGYVDTSAIWQVSGGRTDVGRSYDDAERQNGFNINVTQLNLDRPVDPGDWGAGYKVSIVAGPDAQVAAGASGAPVGVHSAYVKLHAPLGNGLNLKVGIFPSIVGYEYFESYKNANYSHSYGFYLEPGRQTGIVGDYKINEVVSFSLGAGNSYSPGRANVHPLEDKNGALKPANGKLNLMGSLSLAWPGHPDFWFYGTHERGTTGVPGTLGVKAAETFLGLGLPSPWNSLNFVLTYDHTSSDRTGDPREPGYPPSRASAASFYAVYKAPSGLTLGNRIDYAIGAPGAFGADVTGKAPNLDDKYLSEVLTLGYPIWAHVTSRAELRWDRDLSERGSGRFAFGDSPEGSRNSVSLAVNIVYVF